MTVLRFTVPAHGPGRSNLFDSRDLEQLPMVIRGPGPAAALSTSSVSSKTSPTLGVWKALIPLRHPTEAHNMASKCAQRPTRLLRLAAVTVKLTMPLLRRHSSSAGKGLDADQELRLDEEENAVIWPTYLGMKSGRGHVPGGHQQSPLATTTVISMTAYRLRGGNGKFVTLYTLLFTGVKEIPHSTEFSGGACHRSLEAS
jgi:hypothetical protein